LSRAPQEDPVGSLAGIRHLFTCEIRFECPREASSAPGSRVGQLIVSYSRHDESFVHRLHAVLERELQGTRVWLDRDDMPSRMRSFRVEYVDAATSSDRMLLVVSPAAMRSPVCRRRPRASAAPLHLFADKRTTGVRAHARG